MEVPGAKVGHQILTPVDIQREADRLVLSKYGPPGVVVNNEMEILQFRGQTGAYLEPAPGVASLNLLKMAREGLLSGLRAAVDEARRSNAPARRLVRSGHVPQKVAFTCSFGCGGWA